jgi:hypothetical protein
MFLRMTKSIRIWTGGLVALGYLACVLMPGPALALGTGPAPCLTIAPAVVAAPTPMHDAMPEHAMHRHRHADGNAPVPTHHHDGKAAPGPCCAMMCATALPAALPAVVVPARPASALISAADLSLPGAAPPLLYRPPIS